jgi:hypothetical protein
MRFKKVLITLIVLFVFLASASEVNKVLAQAPSQADLNSWIFASMPSLAGLTVGQIISRFLPYIFGLAGFAVLIYAVFGGFQVMNSQGDPKQMAQGREKITYAVVGFIIMAVAYLIVQLIGRVLGIEQIITIFS